MICASYIPESGVANHLTRRGCWRGWIALRMRDCRPSAPDLAGRLPAALAGRYIERWLGEEGMAVTSIA